jgi:hypothetical protein
VYDFYSGRGERTQSVEWRLTMEEAVKVSEQIISQTGRFNIARISIKIVGGKPNSKREFDMRKNNEIIYIYIYKIIIKHLLIDIIYIYKFVQCI